MPLIRNPIFRSGQAGTGKVSTRHKFFLTFTSGLLYLGVLWTYEQLSDGPDEPPPALGQLLKELSNFRAGRGIYLGNSGKSLCT